MRPFADVVRQIDGGVFYDDLTAQLAEVVQAVSATGKTGELTLKLKVKPNGSNSVSIIEQVTAKVPEPPRGATIFFVTEAGDLLRDDPRQAKLPLRDMKADGEMRETANG